MRYGVIKLHAAVLTGTDSIDLFDTLRQYLVDIRYLGFRICEFM